MSVPSATSTPAPGGRATLFVVAAVVAMALAVSGLAAARGDAARGQAADGGADTQAAAAGPGGDGDAGASRSGAGAAWPRQVALPDGTSLTLTAPPHAVVPAAAGCVDLVVALVGPERVAALPEQALQYSALRTGGDAWAHVRRLAAYEAEPLLAAGADLVLCHDWQAGVTTQRLREAGVPVVVLRDPVDWPGARAQLELVGRLLGAEARAAEQVAAYDARVAALCPRGEGRSALALSWGGAGGWVAGARTTNHEMLRLAGLRNLAADDGLVGHEAMTLEGLLERDPDALLVTPDTRRWLLAEPALADLRAVRSGHVLAIPGWLYTATSQHLVDGAEHLVAALARADAGEPPVEFP